MRIVRNRPKLAGSLLGLALSCVAAIWLGLLGAWPRLELAALDLRIRHFGRLQPGTPIVHVDIDDGSLDRVGRWPWRRSQLAELVRTLDELGAKHIFVDLLLSEYEQPYIDDPRYGPYSDVEPNPAILGDISEQNAVFGDLELADAFRTAGNVCLAAQFDLSKPAAPRRQTPSRDDSLRARIHEALRADFTLTEQSLADALHEDPVDVAAVLAGVKKQVARERVERLFADGPVPELQSVLVAMLGEHADRRNADRNDVLAAYRRQLGLRCVFNSAPSLATEIAHGFAQASSAVPPQLYLAQAVAGMAVVNFAPDGDGVVRRVPLVVDYEGRAVLHMGLAAACEIMSLDAAAMTLGPDRVLRVPRRDGTPGIAAPLDARGDLIINWTATAKRWRQGRDFPHVSAAKLWSLVDKRRQMEANQTSINYLLADVTAVTKQVRVLAATETGLPGRAVIADHEFRRKVNEQLDLARCARMARLRRGLARHCGAVGLSPADASRSAESGRRPAREDGGPVPIEGRQGRATLEPVPREVSTTGADRALQDGFPAIEPDDEASKMEQQAAELLREIEQQQQAAVAMVELTCQEIDALPPDALSDDPEGQEEARQYRWARRLVTEDIARLRQANERLAEEAARIAAELRPAVEGKYAFLGFAATAQGDIVTTPIDPRTNGGMCHAQVLNSLLQGRFIVPPRLWLDAVICLVLGAAAGLLTATRGPRFALLAVLAIMSAYGLLNAYGLFQRLGLWVALAGPLLTTGFVWAGVTLFRQLTAERERRFFAKQLSQYTSPAIAARIAESPEAAQAFKTVQTREMTCLFSALQGFTTISEQEDPEVVQFVLNTYLDRMSRVIWKGRGLINKFMGDGIMAFFNASVDPLPEHARAACETCLSALDEMDRLRAEMADHPTAGAIFQKLYMRIGLATGPCKNGDLGSELKADYTVIGDVVNLAARLEPANKVFGTRLMVSGATRDAVADLYEFRRLAELQVKGKAKTTTVFEIVCRKGELTEEQRAYIQRFEAGVELYKQRRWDDCIVHFTRILARRPDDLGASRYIDACQESKVFPPPDAWAGALELKEK